MVSLTVNDRTFARAILDENPGTELKETNQGYKISGEELRISKELAYKHLGLDALPPTLAESIWKTGEVIKHTGRAFAKNDVLIISRLGRYNQRIGINAETAMLIKEIEEATGGRKKVDIVHRGVELFKEMLLKHEK